MCVPSEASTVTQLGLILRAMRDVTLFCFVYLTGHVYKLSPFDHIGNRISQLGLTYHVDLCDKSGYGGDESGQGGDKKNQ